MSSPSADPVPTADPRDDFPAIPFATFLETFPPNTSAWVQDAVRWVGQSPLIAQPDLQLHCDGEQCQGVRFFFWPNPDTRAAGIGTNRIFAEYLCWNCMTKRKIFAFAVMRETGERGKITAVKFGEIPQFGPPIPARAITLIGPDRALFILGRRAENLGMGIGAYAYYRRVVENQKGRLIEQLSKAAAKLGASPDVIKELDRAASEQSFTRAIDLVKDAIPQNLLIKGHNPLTLLHASLSEGLHQRTEEECLKLAQSIRMVLFDLAERISAALKDDAELSRAVTELLKDSSQGLTE